MMFAQTKRTLPLQLPLRFHFGLLLPPLLRFSDRPAPLVTGLWQRRFLLGRLARRPRCGARRQGRGTLHRSPRRGVWRGCDAHCGLGRVGACGCRSKTWGPGEITTLKGWLMDTP